MNRVITPAASITAGQPIVANNGAGTLPFMEDGYQEAMSSIIQGLLGSYNTNDLIILYGVVITLSTTSTTNDTANWTAGAIYYNGEIYTVPASTGGGVIKSVGEVFLYQTSISYAAFDPVIFKDSVSRNCHQIRQITIGHGATGSGLADVGSSTTHKALNVISGFSNQISVSLINGYTSAVSLPLIFRKDAYGNISMVNSAVGAFMQQQIVAPSTVTTEVFAVLPSGYIPPSPKSLLVAGGVQVCRIDIDTSGNLSVRNTSSGGTIAAFSSFYMDSFLFNVLG